MNAYYAYDVSVSTLIALLKQESSRWPWLYCERMDAIELRWLGEKLTELETWSQARAFGPESELTWWQQLPGQYDLRLLTDATVPEQKGLIWSEPEAWDQVDLWTSQEEIEFTCSNSPSDAFQKHWIYSLLHGELGESQDGETSSRWSEVRIPAWIYYPLPADQQPLKRIVLVTQPLQRPSSGRTALSRLVSVTSCQPKE